MANEGKIWCFSTFLISKKNSNSVAATCFVAFLILSTDTFECKSLMRPFTNCNKVILNMFSCKFDKWTNVSVQCRTLNPTCKKCYGVFTLYMA